MHLFKPQGPELSLRCLGLILPDIREIRPCFYRAVLSFFAVIKINYLVEPEKNSNFVM